MNSLTSAHYAFVAKQAAFDKLYGRKRDFSGMFEKDGRKRNAVVRQLWEEGLIEKDKVVSNNYITTELAYTRIDSQPVDPLDIWTKSLLNQHTFRDFDPRYDVINVTWWENVAQIKWLIEHKDEFQWYVMDESPLRYLASHYADNPNETSVNGCTWYGPMTLEEAQVVFQNWYKNHNSPGDRSLPVLGFNTKELIETAKTTRQNNRMQKVFIENIGWGLIQLGILNEDEVEGVHGGEPRGLVLQQTTMNLGDNPEVWATRVEENIEKNNKIIKAAEDNIRILKKIRDNISEFGGWNKFREEFKNRIEEEFKKGAKSEN